MAPRRNLLHPLILLAFSSAYALGCGGDDGGGSTEPDSAIPADVADAGAEDDTTPVEDTGVDEDSTPVEDTSPPEDTPIIEDTGVDDDTTTEPDSFFDPDVQTDTVEDTGPPEPIFIDFIDPATGTTEGGTRVILFGSGFTTETEVFIGGSRVEGFDLVDAETILARTPPNAAGVYDVKVSSSAGESILEAGFTYIAPLEVLEVAPGEGPERGGTPVSVYGEGFTPESLVSIGGRLGIDIAYRSDTRIDFTAPPGTAGSADVRVTNATGSEVIAGGFVYFAETEIDAVTPAVGPSAGGVVATITGAGFDEATQVRFGPLRAEVTFVDANTLEVEVPPGAPGPADVEVIASRGGDTLIGGYWYVSEDPESFDVLAVIPDEGSASGGELVTIVAPGVENSDLAVIFGDTEQTVVEMGFGYVTVETAGGAVGPVDVTVEFDAETATVADGFAYIEDLTLGGVDPASGPVGGGDTVTITGTGFTSATEVRFGPSTADVTFVDTTELTAITPPGSVGPAAVTLTDGARAVVDPEGYFYETEAAVASMDPTRGAIAGNTYVLIRGEGFVGEISVAFDGVEVPELEIVDSATLAVRTPPHEEGSVPVTVTVEGEELRVPGSFTYYDPFTPDGGWWGDAIDGSVNVTVIEAITGTRIEGAYVTLALRADEVTYAGRTNENGQVTLSGPDLVGRQTVTASAPGYSSTTVTNVDAENLVIILNNLVPPPPSGPPPGEPWPIIRGNLSGLDKIIDPGPDETLIGVIRTTTPVPAGTNPPGTGITQVAYTPGRDTFPYEMASRPGEVAVVAICGVLNEVTGDFRPLYMGVARGLNPRFGETYDVDLECDIHMSQPMTFKFINPPLEPGGAEINRAIPFLDFGGEGGIDLLTIAEGTNSIISNDNFVALDEPGLEATEYFVIGQSEPRDGGIPFSVAIGRDIVNPDERVNLGPMLPPADLSYPSAPARNLIERRFEWELASDVDADFYYAFITDMAQETTFWEVYLPGDELGFNLPFFPPDAEVGPLPTGNLIILVYSIDAISFDYDAFEGNDFGFNNWNAYSVNGWVFNNPG